MHFVLTCKDKPGHLETRMENREAHLAYLKEHMGQLFAGGPTLDDEGAMNGSILILDFPDKAAAQAFADNDPYFKAGLFESVTILPWKKVIPAS